MDARSDLEVLDDDGHEEVVGRQRREYEPYAATVSNIFEHSRTYCGQQHIFEHSRIVSNTLEKRGL